MLTRPKETAASSLSGYRDDRGALHGMAFDRLPFRGAGRPSPRRGLARSKRGRRVGVRHRARVGLAYAQPLSVRPCR